MANLTDLVPVSRSEFAAELAPCLSLTAPAGMTGEAQQAWYAAAYRALDGIPIALLKRGAAAAMLKADHPAKIVPAIIKEIDADWAWRRKMAVPYVPQPEALIDRVPVSERREVGVMADALVRKLKASAETAAEA